jgi:hypothetical protein
VLEDQGQTRRYMYSNFQYSTCRRQQGYCSSEPYSTHIRTTTHYAEPSPALRASHRIASDAPATPPAGYSSGNRHDTKTDNRHRSDNNACPPAPGTHEIIELSETRLLDTPASARA